VARKQVGAPPSAPTDAVAKTYVDTNPRLPISLTEEQYNAITPVAGQIYYITEA